MAILSIDLAYKRYADIGVVVMKQEHNSIKCELVEVKVGGTPTPEALAEWINGLCLLENIRIVLLDGPQGWKARDNGLLHSRCCERELNTPAKTGEPFSVKPANYGPFVEFSISVYEALASLGWERLSRVGSSSEASRLLIESFPLSAWRSLGIPHLPAKSKRPGLTWWIETLQERFALCASGSPTHDQLQAMVSGLAGLAIECNRWDSCDVAGSPPVSGRGYWYEGFIVNPRCPA
jgi:Protein of unknown function (DUF429)